MIGTFGKKKKKIPKQTNKIYQVKQSVISHNIHKQMHEEEAKMRPKTKTGAIIKDKMFM